MAPPDRIEHALTLVGLKPTYEPVILGPSRSALVISVLIIVDHFLFLDTHHQWHAVAGVMSLYM